MCVYTIWQNMHKNYTLAVIHNDKREQSIFDYDSCEIMIYFNNFWTAVTKNKCDKNKAYIYLLIL